LLVAGVVVVEEHALAVGAPPEVPAGVPRHLAVAPPRRLAGLDVQDVQFVAAGDVVVIGDPVAVGRDGRVRERREGGEFLERIVPGVVRHDSVSVEPR